jgi:uncharacterized protein YmfQ (DUF2313 family)
MGLNADDYSRELQALLPPGPAWDIGGNTTAAKLVAAWADELARIQADIDRLVDESDPRTTYYLLADYERIFGLPSDCMAGTSQTLEQRRSALAAQMASVGGQSRAYFIALAAAAGFTVTITEFAPHTVLSAVNYPIYGLEWRFIWQVNGSGLAAPLYLPVNAGVDEPLAVWQSNLLVCLFNRLKPAHTLIIFA